MSAYCDRADCRREMAHDHPATPDTQDHNPAAKTSGSPVHVGTGEPSLEVKPSDGPDDTTLENWREAWQATEARRTTTEATLRQIEAERRATIRFMRDAGTPWATIGEITGLTRSRLNQLYR